jgi:uncharacterized protein
MTRGDSSTRLAKSAHIRLIFTALGWFLVLLGIIGIFIPVMPTTPFLIAAAACFARGSASAYDLLIGNRYCGPHIHRWRTEGTVPIRTKILAISLIVISMSVSIAFFVPLLWIKIAMGLIGLAVIVYLIKLPTRL